MRHHIVLSLALGLMAAGTSKADEVLKSPDGDIALTFEIRDGRPTYFVDFKGKQVIAPSTPCGSLSGAKSRKSATTTMK